MLVSALASLVVELGSGNANTVKGLAKVPVLVQLDLLIHGALPWGEGEGKSAA